MLYHTSPTYLLLFGVGAILVYCLIKAIGNGSKLFPFFSKLASPSPLPITGNANVETKRWSAEDLLPTLLDKPADHPSEQAGLFEAPEEDGINFELFEEESGTTLLKEAEQVVEQIQDVVNNLQPGPAVADEALSKISSIVSEYRLFLDTEYFDAINTFIVVTIQRDCGVTVSEEDVQSLWRQQAA